MRPRPGTCVCLGAFDWSWTWGSRQYCLMPVYWLSVWNLHNRTFLCQLYYRRKELRRPLRACHHWSFTRTHCPAWGLILLGQMKERPWKATFSLQLLTQILQDAMDLHKWSSNSELASPGNHSWRMVPMHRCCSVPSADCSFSSRSVQNYLYFKAMTPFAGSTFLWTS